MPEGTVRSLTVDDEGEVPPISWTVSLCDLAASLSSQFELHGTQVAVV